MYILIIKIEINFCYKPIIENLTYDDRLRTLSLQRLRKPETARIYYWKIKSINNGENIQSFRIINMEIEIY